MYLPILTLFYKIVCCSFEGVYGYILYVSISLCMCVFVSMTEDSFQCSSLTRCLDLLLTESKNIHPTDNFLLFKRNRKIKGAGIDTNVSERFETLIFVCVQHMCLRAHTCACVLIISSVKLLQAAVGRNDCSDKQMAPFGLLIIGTAGWQ